jgi:hypothetical protein
MQQIGIPYDRLGITYIRGVMNHFLRKALVNKEINDKDHD